MRQGPESMGRVSNVVADSHLRDAVEGRRILLHHQTDLWRRSTSNVSGRDVSRITDKSELLQQVGCSGGLTGGEWREGNHQDSYATQQSYEEYSQSHKIVHASPVGIFNGVGIRENDANLYDGPSYWGLAGPAILTVKVFATLSGLYFMQYDIPKWIEIGGSFIYWVSDISDNFAKQSELNGDLEIVDNEDKHTVTR